MLVVFGSINVDMVFPVTHLPVEGETVLSPACRLFHGGKGANQAVAAARAGQRVAMAGAVGTDMFAASAMDALVEEQVNVEAVARLEGSTGCAAIGLDSQGRNQIMVASGVNALVGAVQVPDALLRAATVILGQLEVPPACTLAVFERARRHGARVLLNAAPMIDFPDNALALVDVLLVNALECRTLAMRLGLSVPTLAPESSAAATQAAQALAERFGLEVVVTLGGEGAALCREGDVCRVSAVPITPVDTTGAGDTFCGVFAACLAQGGTTQEALMRANAAGALACLKTGARSAMPTAAELETCLAAWRS